MNLFTSHDLIYFSFQGFHLFVLSIKIVVPYDDFFEKTFLVDRYFFEKFLLISGDICVHSSKGRRELHPTCPIMQ